MSGLRNKARGETLLIIDGAPVRLCVTLGALAELEAAFDVASIAELGARLSTLSANDLLLVISALMPKSHPQGSLATLSSADIDPEAAVAAVTEAFVLAFRNE